ncbi:glycosyltransferase [Labedaea rhizosphaerae]|uniref:Glycosyl transferase family 1 n=1 Tax=Labedaea rhizosphaerae TaxID=598644 RepID=A0A4R6SCN2_LABRH|nr:glycosyltransferase [Labedaea rhizosphaerae]TDP96725.1 glycosyl transferase family 1 [Labedaea rhizosphaerae]
MSRRLRILLWHVHGSWTTSFVQGRHDYLLPTLPEGGPWGGGRCGRPWTHAEEVPVPDLASTDVDVVVLQRPEEYELATDWLGRRPGRDVPAVYVEHNTPRAGIPDTRHPLADLDDTGSITIAHVTHFNDLMWDNAGQPTTVIEHGVVDPGHRYTGDLARAAVVVNEPVRRGRVTGTDLLPRLAEVAPLDVYGMGLDGIEAATGLGPNRLTPRGALDLDELHASMARRRAYVHPVRWTSLGLSLIEAMHLGMPVVVLASTEAARAIPPGAGVLATSVADLVGGLRLVMNDRGYADAIGRQAREVALERYGLGRFLDDWDELLFATARASAGMTTGVSR